MPESVPVTVTLVERRPHPIRHFSIERVFDAVALHAPPSCRLARFRVPVAGIRPWAMVRNVLSVRSLSTDVVHVTGDVHYVLPAVRRRAVRILTIHDIDSLHRTSGLRRRLLRLWWYTLPLRAADAVTTVSEETRRQVAAEFPWAAHKVRVVQNPLAHPFDRRLSVDARPEQSAEGPQVVLAIGTMPHKNLVTTAEAARRVGATLRVVGVVDDGVRRFLDDLGVVWSATHGVSDEDLLAEYVRADVLSFPSLHEGFGLPILEAQAAGVPVVTSNRPPMSEVAAGGALLVDPERPEELARAFDELARDSALRRRLVRSGAENAARHAPAVVATEYAEVYLDLVEARAENRPRGSGRA